jgi:hypothetical protein
MTEESSGNLYCYNHPKRETHLRCNKCERPICSSCAVLTPTGYRCKECVRGQQKIFDTAKWWDYPLAVIVGFVLSLLGSLVVSFIGFFVIFVAAFAGIGIAEAVRFVLGRRRSRNLPIITAAAVLLGGIILKTSTLIYIFSYSSSGLLYGLLALLWPAIYAVIAASTVYYRLKGIRL